MERRLGNLVTSETLSNVEREAKGVAGMTMDTAPSASGQQVAACETVQRRRSQLQAALATAEAALLRQPGPDPAAWLAPVRQSLADLGAALALHVDVHEGSDSFHADVVRHQPALASRVTWLQRDHRRLEQQLAALYERVSAPATSETVVRVRSGGLELVHRFARHRQKGADLVWDAFSYDLGGEQ